MAYGLALFIILALLVAGQLAFHYWGGLVEREQQRARRTFESWREAQPEEDDAA